MTKIIFVPVNVLYMTCVRYCLFYSAFPFISNIYIFYVNNAYGVCTLLLALRLNLLYMNVDFIPLLFMCGTHVFL